MGTRRIAAVLAAILSAAASAGAQTADQLTIYGFAIGSKLDIGACSEAGPRAGWTAPCMNAWSGGPAFDGTHGTIEFPQPDEPSGIHSLRYVLDASGALVVVRAVHHFFARDAQFDRLRGKYGKPTSARTTKMTNAMGAFVNSQEAEWRFPRLQVEFTGIVDVRTGETLIGTPAALKALHDQLLRDVDRGRKM